MLNSFEKNIANTHRNESDPIDPAVTLLRCSKRLWNQRINLKVESMSKQQQSSNFFTNVTLQLIHSIKTPASNIMRHIFKAYKVWLATLFVAFLAACSGQEAVTTDASSGSQSTTQTAQSTSSSLLDSLAMLYPNGQLPAERTAQAANELSQNPSVLTLTAKTASTANSAASGIQSLALAAADFKPVNRIQNTTLSGSYFFTIYDSEKDAALVSNPDWRLEGPAFYTLPASSAELSPVYRFRNLINGSYLYTAFESERDSIVANYSANYTLEGVAWRAQQTAAPGYSPLYRFRNLTNGTYLNTAYESEKNAILAQYSAIFTLEGIAYYVLPNAPFALSGTAASGAPFPSGSTLEVVDKTGAIVATTTMTSNDGSYAIPVPASAQVPLILKVSAEGASPMVSIAPTLPLGVVNITPVTNLIAARLSPTGDPAQLAAQLAAGTAVVDASTVNAKKAEVQTVLASVTGALGDTTDPLTGSFTANGTGHDRVLDSLKISILPAGTNSNIEVGIKQKQGEVAAPVKVTFTAGTGAVAVPPALPAVSTANLIPSGTSAQIAALLARMQACYALPKASRTNGGNAATDIIAAECKDIFPNSSPAIYKDNSYTVGNIVGTDAIAWKGIFTSNGSGATGVKFGQPSFEYILANPGQSNDGDVVFTARWIASDGSTDVPSYTARADATGKLFVIGNQSNIDFNVSARVELKDYTHDNFYKYRYLNTGYELYVNSKHLFGKVLVTSPGGQISTLKPIAGGGYSFFGLLKADGSATTTAVMRVAGKYVDSTTTSSSTYGGVPSVNHPRDIDSSFWTTTDWTDTAIQAIPNQGTWKFEFFTLAADLAPIVTSYRRTISRSPSMAEAAMLVWPQLTVAMRDDLKVRTALTGSLGFSTADKIYIAAPGNADAWIVPAGATWAPTLVKSFGNDPANASAGFDDQVNVYSIERKTSISCSDLDGAGLADQHCNTPTDGLYKVGVRVGQINFFGRDTRRVLNSYSVNFRKS